MKNIKEELSMWFNIVPFITVWYFVCYFYNIPFGTKEALWKLPDVVFILVILKVLFSNWIWRFSILQGWLIKYPDLQGTWEGSLQTNWRNPETSEIPGPIPMILVIKQTFNSINCVMHTQESTSYSNASMLNEDDDSGIQRLSYNYTNTPDTTIRGRSAIHYGAATLRIVKERNKYTLQGEYWTSRSTAGSISLKFRTRELLGAFPEDLIPKKKSETKVTKKSK
ncbi:hypothetical protein A3C59_04330 [Candidatus Daviesbacteria bacterium RIFCSPHIGHO2_02_FULL_36_13]|uniref:CD-NTase-associated protein 15 domain-containing protein n=1 Tax=Candidatus Daviesbacteria bacterium RIFCSPHIGHO2_02_FULL_36_13 TaxID=1797768 RepID=A0A1F5JW15_9BACT|nr:MAG: hypothetical protein A3C59_04330 [Candidatus Daviesbacteria bacterium RIFCSPHIGHO2_02_FULL_36_13]